MPYLPQETLDNMLSTLPYDQRKTITDIIHGRVQATVKCWSDECNGRVIAYIHQDNPNDPTKRRIVPATTDDVKKMYLFNSRPRLDGQWGFHCRCGNNSMLSKEEQGTITSSVPTETDLQTIWDKLQKNKPVYPVKDGVKHVDGFSIEENK